MCLLRNDLVYHGLDVFSQLYTETLLICLAYTVRNC